MKSKLGPPNAGGSAETKTEAAKDLAAELLKLKSIRVPLDSIFLDPNNPRFAEEKEESTPDDRIPELDVQRRALERLQVIGIDDLRENIKELGFLTIDRVVVRQFDEGRFVAVEGNRRMAALKTLYKDYKDGDTQSFPEETLRRINEIEVLEYQGNRKDIAWVVQGLRHIASLKNWPKFQRAKFVVGLSEDQKLPPQEISRMLGLKAAEVTSLIRSYHGFKQMQDDDEYGDQIAPPYFAMMDDAVFSRPPLKKWLEWDDNAKRFKNAENFRQLLEWITEGKDGKAYITRAIDVRDVLSDMVDPDNTAHKDLLQAFRDGHRTIDDCKAEIQRRGFEKARESETTDIEPLKADLRRLKNRINTMPVFTIVKKPEDAEQVRALLNEVLDVAKFQLGALDAQQKKG